MSDNNVVPFHRSKSESLLKPGEKRKILLPFEIMVDSENERACLANWDANISCPGLRVASDQSGFLYCSYFHRGKNATIANRVSPQGYSHQYLFTTEGTIAEYRGNEKPLRCAQCVKGEKDAKIIEKNS